MSPRLDIGTGSGEGDNAFGTSRGPSGLTVWNRDPSLQSYGMSRSRSGIDLWALPANETNQGWAVYTFKRNGLAFTVYPGSVVRADVLLVGGGGAGGGGTYGGGGGAGGFVDKHDILIYSHEASAPRDFAYPDGEVFIGAGGAAVPITDVAGPANQGGDSQLGTVLIAHGGGYGARNVLDINYANYPASDGASGGGARGNEVWVEDIPPQGSIYTGIPGRAIYNLPVPEGGDPKDYEEGHDGGHGGDGGDTNHSCGGGGGAAWPATDRPYSISGTQMTGGLGRPCDIGGWYTSTDAFWGGMYKEAGMTYVSWYAGGGAGMERPNLWGFRSGGNGYRGGGSIAADGEPNTGGGGGGNGWYGPDSPEPWEENTNKAPGRAGGSGIVVVRIPMSQKKYVTAPMQLTDGNGAPLFTPVWDPWWENWGQVPVYPAGVTYREVPPNEPHLDLRGDSESAFVWTHLTGAHGHRWGWVDSDFPI